MDNLEETKPQTADVESTPYVNQSLTEKRLLDIAVNVEKAIQLLGVLEKTLDEKINAFMTSLQIHLAMPGAPSATPQKHQDIQDAEIVKPAKAATSKRDYRRS
jgi:hypothetical protein